MNISFYTVESNRRTDNGYGYAGQHIRQSLESLGHSVSFHDETAPIQIDFCQPPLYSHFANQYKIGDTPWESTVLPDDWWDGISKVDELWTTSEKNAQWFEDAGVTKPLKVYKHGIESMWTPKHRKPGSKLKFLHVGEPAGRKGGQTAVDAFVEAFGNREDVHLTIKANGHSTVRVFASRVNRGGPRNILGLPHQVTKNISLIEDSLSIDELVALYHSHDVLVYPSWGEGFGLIPLQGLATGMPTICTASWAPYANHLHELALDSQEWDSPWPSIHPGKMSQPDYGHLVELFKYTFDNYSALSDKFYNSANSVHEEYNWTTLTKNAFSHLIGE